MYKNVLKYAAVMLGLILVAIIISEVINRYSKKDPIAEEPKPDEIIITDLPNGEKLVENKTQGFSVKAESGWFVQENTKGIIVYKNPEKGECKIDSSILKNEDIEILVKTDQEDTKQYETVKFYEVRDIKIGEKTGKEITKETEENGLARVIFLKNKDKIINAVAFPQYDEADQCFNSLKIYVTNANF